QVDVLRRVRGRDAGGRRALGRRRGGTGCVVHGSGQGRGGQGFGAAPGGGASTMCPAAEPGALSACLCARWMKSREQYGHSTCPSAVRLRYTLGWPSGPPPPL